ncbi:methyltransferase, FxLD system [Streptomyces angustmyceticus]|uniref:methyltransferase, FxLD system n=1 Tax=Streptomyces angustmyceticus TaxID=285578 RepID=UPI0036ABAD63
MTDKTGQQATTEQQMRDAMAQKLIELGAARDPRVVAAFRTVRRHLAAPDVDMTETYQAEFATITKTDEHGVDISSVSAPRIQAVQLEQARIEPGWTVLEVGSGGPNAANIAEMVGEQGHVVTMDIDTDVTARAERFVAETGYRNITVVTGDAEGGVPDHAPFDAIIVTVQAADIPPAWVDQLKQGGRLVVPLRMRGMTRTVSLVREGDRLISCSHELCGFVPMQGAGEDRMRLAVLHDVDGEEVALRLDGHPEPDVEALRTALAQPSTKVWSGVTVGGMEPKDHLDLFLTTVLDNLPLMAAKPGARKRGIVAGVSPLGIPTLVAGGSFAYRTSRRSDDSDRWELGAVGHGPEDEKVAERLVDEIQAWHHEYRSRQARIEVYPAGTPDDQLPASGRVIDRPHTRVIISWP